MVDYDDTGRGRAARGGVIAGIIGGVVLIVLTLIGAAVQKTDPWLGLKVAGLPFTGTRALTGGFDFVPVLMGVGTLLASSVFWGVLFGVLFFGLSRPLTLAMGFVWGVVVWSVLYDYLLPMMGYAHFARAVPVGYAIAEYVIFGLAVSIGFLPYREHRPLFRAPREVDITA